MTSTSRRPHLPTRADRPRPPASGPAAGIALGALGASVLLVAAAIALLIGLELIAAATGSDRDLWHVVPVPDGTGGRLAMLIGLMAFFAASSVLLARPRERALSLQAADGAILMPRRATRRLAGEAFSGHPDVVATRPRVKVREGRLSIEARVLLRPGADVARLGPAIRSAATAEFARLTGFAPEVDRVRFKVLRVRGLARHL